MEDLSERPGFDEQFLGVRVGIPALVGVESVLLPYTHFSVLMRPDKRLAAVTALGIDGLAKGRLRDRWTPPAGPRMMFGR